MRATRFWVYSMDKLVELSPTQMSLPLVSSVFSLSLSARTRSAHGGLLAGGHPLADGGSTAAPLSSRTSRCSLPSQSLSFFSSFFGCTMHFVQCLTLRSKLSSTEKNECSNACIYASQRPGPILHQTVMVIVQDLILLGAATRIFFFTGNSCDQDQYCTYLTIIQFCSTEPNNFFWLSPARWLGIPLSPKSYPVNQHTTLAFLKDACMVGKHFQHSSLDTLQQDPLNCFFLTPYLTRCHINSLGGMPFAVSNDWIILVHACPTQVKGDPCCTCGRLFRPKHVHLLASSCTILRLNPSIRWSTKVVPRVHSSKNVYTEIGMLGPSYDIIKAQLSYI